MLASAAWNCPTALPSDYVGESSYTFYPDGCAVSLTNCVSAAQSGPVTLSYLITYMDGSTCEEKITIDCKAVPAYGCCPDLDFKLRKQWPYFQNQVGVFNITNVDANNSICSIEINASPSASFTPVSLIVDGSPSAQSWTASNIPAVGSLTVPAYNNIEFSILGTAYNGVVEVCVTMCDGSVCCYEVNWKGLVVIDDGVSVGNAALASKLTAVSVQPSVLVSLNERIKYVSFGYYNQEEALDNNGFFAASAIGGGDCNDEGREIHPATSSVGRHNAFFELQCPVTVGSDLNKMPVFNMVFVGDLPEIGCALFGESGALIYSGKINNIESDTVSNAVIDPVAAYSSLLNLVSVYPNPNNGEFTMQFTTATSSNVDVFIYNNVGKLMKTDVIVPREPGVQNEKIDAIDLPAGLYHIMIESEGNSASKTFIKH